MKLSCTQENLANALALVGPVAAKGGSLPILQNILLEAQDGALRLKATNLEIGITVHVRGKVEQEGQFTVNGRLASDYVNLVSAERINLVLDGDHLAIQAGNQQTKIFGQGAEEFPVIPAVLGGSSFLVDARALREALAGTLFSVSLNEARPEISGVLFVFSGQELVLAGTDSYRLAESRVPLKSAAKTELRIIVPMRSLQELARLLGRAEGEAEIHLNENQVQFNAADAELVSRVIVGNFPDYKQIIPAESKTSVTLNKEPLARAIKSASLFCRAGLNHVSLQFSSDKILVSASASQVGENTSEVPAKVEGPDVDIVFDYRFLLDGLNAIDGNEVSIRLNDGASPCIFAPKTGNYIYLVMPIRQ